MRFNFSFKRLGLLLRKYWFENRRALCVEVLSVTAVMALFAIVLTWKYYSIASYNMDGDVCVDAWLCVGGLSAAYSAFGVVFICLGASKVTVALRSKGSCMAELMLPASSAEKFAALAIRAFVFVPLAYFVMLFFSEAVRWLFHTLVHGDVVTEFVTPFFYLGYWFGGDYGFTVFTQLCFFASFFFFGSFIFSKRPFLKSALLGAILTFLLWVVMVATVLVFARTHGLGADMNYNIDNKAYVYLNSLDGEALLCSVNIYLWVIIAFFVGWSYLRYRDTEVVRRF